MICREFDGQIIAESFCEICSQDHFANAVVVWCQCGPTCGLIEDDFSNVFCRPYTVDFECSAQKVHRIGVLENGRRKTSPYGAKFGVAKVQCRSNRVGHI